MDRTTLKAGSDIRRKGCCSHRFIPVFIICIAILLTASLSCALDVPPLKGRVNDYANVISPRVRTQLENELKNFELSDSTQIVILTINSLEGDSLEDFSIRVAEAWKIGQKGKDNGAILLVSKNDRRTRIEVGRGLEGKLTDLVSGRIVQFVINPQFKRGDFDAGFQAGIRAMIDVTRGEFNADKAPLRPTGKRGLAWIPSLLIFGAIFLLILGRISRFFGAGAGFIGFGALGLISGSSLVTVILLAILGLVLGIFLPFLFGGRSGGGGFGPGGFWTGSDFGSGGDSFGGGGDFGGGDSLGGGGGDFGGGGASGDW